MNDQILIISLMSCFILMMVSVISFQLNKIIKKGSDKYEFYIAETWDSDCKHEWIQQLQDNGWVLCGDVHVQAQLGSTKSTKHYIPFKRKIKK